MRIRSKPRQDIYRFFKMRLLKTADRLQTQLLDTQEYKNGEIVTKPSNMVLGNILARFVVFSSCLE